ncbi:hypothetical protein [Bradyrhizobium sp. Tv2a-2]|uniref:hypothetical protein n=1 Tax=Bradyrhizobium sp. Tv2a-2 TaxID=113395 RepID=UPI0004151258|nr:hypothetical protein [Bradyrhizobium sp. Tv2a-2]
MENDGSEFAATLTKLRGLVRKKLSPEKKMQASLLREMVENRRPADVIERQMGLMAND